MLGLPEGQTSHFCRSGKTSMKSILAVFVFISCISAAWADDVAPQSNEPSHVSQLKWLDSADPDKMLQSDIKAGNFKFFVVCGLGCETVGVASPTQCYPLAKQQRMAGTADALESDEDGRYQEKAMRFAIRYNVQLAEYLSKHGMTDCVAGESWSGAREAMDRRLAEQDVAGDTADISYSKQTHKFRLLARLSPENRNASIEGQLCQIALEYHLSGRVIIEIYDRKTDAPLSSIECRYGEVLPSDWKPVPSDYPEDDQDPYIQAINAAVNAAVHRPNVEMQPNATGVVEVSFDCTDNVVTNLRIDTSSRERAFDKAAIDAVNSAKLPIVPKELKHKTVHVSVEVRIPAVP